MSIVQTVMNTVKSLITLPLEKFSSEHKRLEYFESKNTYIKPQQIVIGQRLEMVKNKSVRRLVPVNCEQSFISLRQVLKVFFFL